MAKIQLVIEIEERLYKNIIDNDKDDEEFEAMDMAFCDAKPLPKGHGRLGDLDKLEREMYHNAFETDTDLQKWDSGCWIRYKMFENAVDNAPTIIEADGGSEDGDNN